MAAPEIQNCVAQVLEGVRYGVRSRNDCVTNGIDYRVDGVLDGIDQVVKETQPAGEMYGAVLIDRDLDIDAERPFRPDEDRSRDRW